MNVRVLVIVLILVFLTGCIGSKKKTPPKAYITPCAVIGEDILIRAEGKSLGASIVKGPLSRAFVDDLVSKRAKAAWDSYKLDCWWGKSVGEQMDIYYCTGSYVVHELDAENVIKRYVRKEFKIGFDVESYESTGGFHSLTVNTISATCSVA